MLLANCLITHLALYIRWFISELCLMFITDGLWFRRPPCASTLTLGTSDTNSFRRIWSPTVLRPQTSNWAKDPSLERKNKAFPSIFCSKKLSHKYKRAWSIKKATYCLSSQRLCSQNTENVDKTKKKMFIFNYCR